ncbi:MAG: tail fiber domain-containing protein [Fluviicola sp.]|jgi:hypothetical protein
MFKNKFSNLFWALILSQNSISQSTDAGITGNNYLATKFLGWNNTNGVNPLLTRTNNINRMRLNGTYTNSANQYDIDGYTIFGNTNTTVNTSGYLLLGQNAPFQVGGGNIFDRGAYSLLHLNGGAAVQQNGYRPWMKTGITLTDNQDLSYIGLRQVGNGLDVTETVINWSDNTGATSDDMTFRFTGNSTNITTIDQNDYRSSVDYDGLHIGRFTAAGLFGLGNTFGYANVAGEPANVYVRPQSLFHMSYDRRTQVADELYGFMQITYRRPTPTVTDITGEGQTASDGLRFGIDNEVFGTGTEQHLNGYLRWQEASSFIIQTEDDNNPSIQTNERMRITSLGALDLNYNNAQYFGYTLPTDITRISISQRGTTPLLRPKSLLHLGFDYGNEGTGIEGYRRWMDLGLLTSTNEDHVWLGLKNRLAQSMPVTGSSADSLDAVLAWGTDRVANSSGMVDNFRFIFTGNTFSGGDGSPSEDFNGLEMMRMYPATVYQHFVYNASGSIIDTVQAYGRVGVGDFTVEGVNEQPTQKLDVVGNGRFRYLPDSTYIADSLVTKIVMVDESGVLRWADAVPSSFGAICSDTVNGKLTDDTKVDLNYHNLYFTRNDSIGTNLVGIGYDCGVSMKAKFNTFSKNELWSGAFYVDGNSPIDPIFQGGVESVIDSTKTLNATAIRGYVNQNTYGPMVSQIGVEGEVLGRDVKEAVGVKGISTVVLPISASIGGRFLSNGSASGRAVQAQNRTVQSAGTGSGFGFGGDFSSITTFGQSVNSNTGVTGQANGVSQNNTGARGLASGNGVVNIGVFGQATGGTQNWAGYFQGDVYISGSFGPSDQNLKENVVEMQNADSVLSLLNPVTFDFKTTTYPQLNLADGNQMGVIAQEIEQVLPNIVNINSSPAQYDSLGVEIAPSVTFKTVDYTKLIPLLIAGHQEQNAVIQEKDSLINVLVTQNENLNDRLSALENCLSGILPFLCQMNQQAIQANTPQAQEQLRKDIAVTLTNRSTIILDQNVPNPFAEQTVINFSIPETVKKAQIHFYNQEGRIIQTVDVIERGLGSVTVFGADLSSGVYTYTLVADGQIVATKKMMKM